MRKYLYLAIALLLVIIVAWFGWRCLSTTYDAAEAAWLYLPHGTTQEELNDQLTSVLGPGMGAATMTVYKAAAKSDQQTYGAYRVAPGTTAKELARRLIRHRQTPIRLTFNNLRTLDQLAQRISQQMEFSADEFTAAMDSVLPTIGFKTRAQFPAAFLPDTYEVYWTQTPEQTVKKLLDARNNFWNDQRRAKAKSLGLTPVEAATIASIAEEETNDPEERGVVGRLYLNRLHRAMPLQADPTVKFAVGDFSLRRILGEHLKVSSPYNTYRNPGLPPGPIRIADARSIDALLNSKPHGYIYMCAKPDFSGRHDFTADYNQHLRNAKRYHQALEPL